MNFFRGSRARPYSARELSAQMALLNEASRTLATLSDRREMVAFALRAAAEGCHASRALALEFSRDKNAYLGAAPAIGVGDDEVAKLMIGVGESEHMDAAFFRGVTFVSDQGNQATIQSVLGARNALLAQLRAGDEHVGLLVLLDKDRRFGDFGDEDAIFAQTIARVLAVALSKAKPSETREPAGARKPGLAIARRRFDDHARLEVERAEALGHSLGCIAIEIVDFDALVTKHGRNTAEFAVSQLADSLRKNARHIDVIARDDAKTLIILLPGTDAAAVKTFWARLANQVVNERFPSVGPLKLRHGVACYPGNAASPNQVVVTAVKELRSGPASSSTVA